MTGSRLSRKALQAQTKERICEAAIELIVAKGFHATSIQDIVDRAGFSKGAFFSNFASKTELLFALSEQLMQAERARLMCVLEASHETFLEAFEKYTEELENERAGVVLVIELQMMALRDEAFNLYYQQLNASNDAAFDEIIEGLFSKLGKKPPISISSITRICSDLIQGSTLRGATGSSTEFKQVIGMMIGVAEDRA